MLEKTSLEKVLIFYISSNIHNHYPLDIKAVPYLLTFHSNTLDHSSAKHMLVMILLGLDPKVTWYMTLLHIMFKNNIEGHIVQVLAHPNLKIKIKKKTLLLTLRSIECEK